MKLEAQPQRKLYLAICSEPDGAFARLPQQAKGRAGSCLGVRLTWLKATTERKDRWCQPVGRIWVYDWQRWQTHVQRRRRQREIGPIEDVENLRSELNPYRFRDWDSFVEDEVDLTEVRAAKRVATQIPEGPGSWNSEGSWVKQVAIVIEVRADPGK